ncbi:semaphorin-1A-like isoform X2 [Penaeus japonicus]|uniref:semaphorin-1A-like isoform X2 n=1 Tax=Penaeus japonicus TaxID=27405 RepID=UPI001C71219B|nr:semaphorin-1A-like isoform X2 [Penaeus japonicus]
MLGAGTAVSPNMGVALRRRVLAPHTMLALHLLPAVVVLFAARADATPTISFLNDHKPRSITLPDELEAQIFPGNNSVTDYFRLLQRDGDSLLIGARNIVYNISIHSLEENYSQRIVWYSTDKDSTVCFNKGKSVADCQNYIRVLAKEGDGQFLVCGTNAYKPLCRHYAQQVDGSFNFTETNGAGQCPYDPRHNSTYVYVDGELYSGTVADFQGTIPLIFRQPLKTDHNDYKQLNAPDFVHSFDYGDFVFFFFRETAVEYMNCGKRVYSRVARVCKGDRGGGPQRLKNSWTSFLKSRLNCSVPGGYPFYFDEIQSTTDIITGIYGGESHEIIYAVFTTPPNSIPGSAVCAFSMRAILDTFEGSFKEQQTLNSNWLPVHPSKVPEPRPGSCVPDSQTLRELNVNFAKDHSLMDEAVPGFFGRPLLIKASFEYRFNKIVVDPQVNFQDGKTVDVLFIATDGGIIFKAINAQSSAGVESIDPVIIEEIRVFDRPVPIVNMQLAKQAGGEGKLIIITDDEVKSIDLHRCHRATTCSSCVGLQDPYCGWFVGQGRCGPLGSQFAGPVFQNVSGHHYQCSNKAPCPTEVETCAPCVCPEPPSSRPPPVTEVTPTEGSVDHSTIYDPPVDEDYSFVESNRIPPITPAKDVNVAKNNAVPGVSSEGDLPNDILGPLGREPGIGIAYAEGGVTGPVVGASLEGPPIYSAETLAIAVTTACVAALVIGFISGFLFSRKCRGDEYAHTYSETPYLDSKLSKRDNLVPSADPNMYTANNKHINNLVTNYNPKNINGKSNTNTTTDSKLLKPAKCAYI